MSYLESHLDNSIARGATGSIDILYSPINLIATHLYFSNIGPSISYGLIPESLPAEAGLSMQFFPFTQSFSDKSHLHLTAGIGARKIADQPVIAGLSTELKFWNTFAIRTGYEYSYGTETTIEGLGAGATLQFGKYGIDGAWRYESKDLGLSVGCHIKTAVGRDSPKNCGTILHNCNKTLSKEPFRSM